MNTTIDSDPHIDAFLRYRASLPSYRFDSQFTNQIDSDLWDTKVRGTGVIGHDTTHRMAVMVTQAAGDECILQSHYHNPYTPGRSQEVLMSFSIEDAGTGPFGRSLPGQVHDFTVGYGDGLNGIYLRVVDGSAYIELQSSNNIIQRKDISEWVVDIDFTKTQLFYIDLQALYVGRVRCGLFTDTGLNFVAQFNHTNTASRPYIAQASLPVRYVVKQSGDTPLRLNAICCTVISEGGQGIVDIAGRPFTLGNAIGAAKTVATTATPVCSIRVTPTLNGILNHALVIPKALDVLVGTGDTQLDVVLNATLTGATYAAGTAGGVLQLDTAATAVTGGTVIASMFQASSGGSGRISAARGMGDKVVMAYSHLLAKADTLTIVGYARSGTSTVNAQISGTIIR